jgi:hypothetical protein
MRTGENVEELTERGLNKWPSGSPGLTGHIISISALALTWKNQVNNQKGPKLMQVVVPHSFKFE